MGDTPKALRQRHKHLDYEAAAISLYEEPEEGRFWKDADEDMRLAYRLMAEDAVNAALVGVPKKDPQ